MHENPILSFWLDVVTKVPTLFLSAIAQHYSCFSVGTNHGLSSEATAEDRVNAQGKSCSGRCELTFVVDQIKTLPQAASIQMEKDCGAVHLEKPGAGKNRRVGVTWRQPRTVQ